MTIGDLIYWLTVSTGIIWAIVTIALSIGLRLLKTVKDIAKPTVSVLIAARNEEDNIGNCLEALSKQDYPVHMRVILVIDDNSTDDTWKIANGFIGNIPGLKVIKAGKPAGNIAPKKNALITGIDATAGDVIITTDADCTPPTGWISSIAGLFEPDVQAVVGFSPLKGHGIAGAISRFDSLVNAVISAGALGLGKAASAVGRNFAYRRSAYDDAGGFGSSAIGASGDDDLLLQRIASKGGKIIFATDPNSFVPARGKDTIVDWLRMKRRHFSAGKRYSTDLIILGTLLYLFNPVLIASTILSIVGILDPVVIAAIWGAKLSVDGLALSRGARLFHTQSWIIPWIFAELISPFLLTVLIPASQIGKIRWKGRKLKK
ncbi:MAG: glycosyltransferase [Candidatus Hatepunaea meridiana]|nr:glycosyltransferase [Candidatus Hatepunaea meridiana]